MTREQSYMQEATKAGTEGMRTGKGGPFGCVIVKDDAIIGSGCNKVLETNDPTAHAEVIAIRNACKTLASFQLEGCEIYTTCEPCPMCMGAIYWARPSKVYFVNSRADAAGIGFDDSFIYEQIALPFEKRTIHMEQIYDEQSKRMFVEWKKMENKTLY